MIVCFVDIGDIVDRHCLNYIFINTFVVAISLWCYEKRIDCILLRLSCGILALAIIWGCIVCVVIMFLWQCVFYRVLYVMCNVDLLIKTLNLIDIAKFYYVFHSKYMQ